MKESTLLEMQNKIKSLTNVIEYLMQEHSRLRELGIGTLETVKLMPGYEDAIEQLRKTMEDNVKQKQATKDGDIEQDTK